MTDPLYVPDPTYPPYLGPGYPPPPGPPTAEPRAPSRLGPVLAVAGLALAAVGLFALPVQDYRVPGGQVGFVAIRSVAGTPEQFGLRFDGPIMTGFAQYWWTAGLLLAVAVLAVLVCAAVADAARFVTGALLALCAPAVMIAHSLALVRTLDYRTIQGGPDVPAAGTLFHDAGIGTWIGLAGLAATAVGGLLTVLVQSRLSPMKSGPGPTAGRSG
jgi:hypothetical protein